MYIESIEDIAKELEQSGHGGKGLAERIKAAHNRGLVQERRSLWEHYKGWTPPQMEKTKCDYDATSLAAFPADASNGSDGDEWRRNAITHILKTQERLSAALERLIAECQKENGK